MKGWWLKVGWPYPLSHVTFWNDKKALNVDFHITYVYQNCQSGPLLWRSPTHQVTGPYDLVVTWQRKKRHIWTSISHVYQIWQSGNLFWRDPNQFCFMGAVLFYVEYAVRLGDSKTCTEEKHIGSSQFIAKRCTKKLKILIFQRLRL